MNKSTAETSQNQAPGKVTPESARMDDTPFAHMPAELRNGDAFTFYTARGDGKKIPMDVQAALKGEQWRYGSPTNPATWGTLQQALSFVVSQSSAIGIQRAVTEGLVALDFDDCVDCGALLPWAAGWVARFLRLGAYGEFSPSDTGVHLWVKGALKANFNRAPKWANGGRVEGYAKWKLISITGRPLPGCRPAPYGLPLAQGALDDLQAACVPAPAPAPEHIVTTPTATQFKKRSDSDVLERMFQSRHGHELRRLYDATGGSGDHSADTLRLLVHLLFWTDGDTAQSERLFKASALGNLEAGKWDSKRSDTTWGAQQLTKACAYYQKVQR